MQGYYIIDALWQHRRIWGCFVLHIGHLGLRYLVAWLQVSIFILAESHGMRVCRFQFFDKPYSASLG